MGRPNLLILSIYIAGVRLSLASESVNFGKNDFPASLRRSGSSEFAGMDRAPVGFSILNEVLRRENEHPEWSDPKGDADLDHYTEMMRTQSSGCVECHAAAASPDPKQGATHLFEHALENNPDDAKLMRLFARFLHLTRCKRPPMMERLSDPGDRSRHYAARAEELFKKALELDGNDADALCDYGCFLFLVREANLKAEYYFRLALGVHPRSNFTAVLELLRPPPELAPRAPTVLSLVWRFALRVFCFDSKRPRQRPAPPPHIRYPPQLDETRRPGNFIELMVRYAQALYERGLDISANPIRDDLLEFDCAHQLLRWAVLYEPRSHLALNAYAGFLHRVRKKYNEAELYYQRSIEANPRGVQGLNDYAFFLCYIRKEYLEAYQLWNAALDIDPGHLDAVCNLGYLKAMCLADRNEAPGEDWWRGAAQADITRGRDYLGGLNQPLKQLFSVVSEGALDTLSDFQSAGADNAAQGASISRPSSRPDHHQPSPPSVRSISLGADPPAQ